MTRPPAPASGSAIPAGRETRAARVAVAVMFTVNGAAVANWLPRIPEVQRALDLGEGALGLALAAAPTGATLASIVIGPVLARFGSRVPTIVMAMASCVAVTLLPLAPNGPMLAAALLVLGICEGSLDVAMNAHGLAVQHAYRRSILNGFHAWWSAGALAGALTGSAAAGAGLAPQWHLLATGVVLGFVALMAGRWLLPACADRSDRGLPSLARPTGALLLICAAAAIAGLAEGSAGDWAAVHLATTLEAPPGLLGSAFAAFALLQLLGRTVGDRVVNRVGTANTVRVGGLLGAVGLTIAATAGGVPTAVIGYALLGLGMAPMVPAVFGAAGRLPGFAAGPAIAVASIAVRTGSIAGPPLIGATAAAASLRLGLGLAGAACALLVALAAGTRHADIRS